MRTLWNCRAEKTLGLLCACLISCGDPAAPGGAEGGAGGAGGSLAHGGAGGTAGGATGGAGTAGSAGAGTGGNAAGGVGGEAGSAGAFDGPEWLSETGLYADIAARELAPGVLAYDVQYPLWSDGSVKRRYVRLPPGTQIDTASEGAWKFPEGTKAWKEFERAGVVVETRMLEKLADDWRYVAYVWQPGDQDARAAPAGLVDARGTAHDVPSTSQCVECHAGNREYFLGLSLVQLSGPAESLSAFAAAGALSHPVAAQYSAPGDAGVGAALGYLHGNCGHCHTGTHPLGARVRLRLELAPSELTAESTGFFRTAVQAQANHTIAGTRTVVVPGAPDASQLYVRMGIRDLVGMPPVGTELVDPVGQSLVFDLILGL